MNVVTVALYDWRGRGSLFIQAYINIPAPRRVLSPDSTTSARLGLIKYLCHYCFLYPIPSNTKLHSVAPKLYAPRFRYTTLLYLQSNQHTALFKMFLMGDPRYATRTWMLAYKCFEYGSSGATVTFTDLLWRCSAAVITLTFPALFDSLISLGRLPSINALGTGINTVSSAGWQK